MNTENDLLQICGKVPQTGAGLDSAQVLDLLSSCTIDLTSEVKEPEPLVCIGDNPVFTKGNISVIGGPAKSRKTFLIIHLASKFLDENMALSVLLIDTEMAKFHTVKSVKRIHRLVGWDEAINSDRLHVLCLRECSTEERVSLLTEALDRFNPSLVFIDGIRDMVKDFNDPRESSDMVNLLMKLSSSRDCHICSVLHENKIGGLLRGHLGTEIQNKSETVIKVSTSGLTSTVTPSYSRNLPFDEFNFQINADGLPELCEAEIETPRTDKLKELFKSLLAGTSSVSYTELSRRLQEKTSLKESAREKKIKKAVELEVIEKNKVGYYILKQHEQTEDILPF